MFARIGYGIVCWLAWIVPQMLNAAERPPNVVILIADDMGYSDLGCYGSEIATPHLDGLAQHGLRFTQFYNTARCWPTRSALLSGYYAQQIHRDKLPTVPGGGQGKRPAWAKLLPERLRTVGYRSYQSGKWHVDGKVLSGGFDHSYELADHNRFFRPANHTEDDKPLPKVEAGPDSYVTTMIADHAIKCLKDHALQHADKPFFSYIAFTSPHFPLQAPQSDIARYRDTYQVGWDQIRQQRWGQMQKLLNLPCELSALEPNIGPPYSFPNDLKILGEGEVNREGPWNGLTEAQKQFQSIKMAIHAAMIDRMDQEIGRILHQLQDMKAFDDTLIFFLSDNGASAEIMVRGDGHDHSLPPGSDKTFLCLGPGWSRTANTPFRRHKTWVHEGGISTPLIVHWPAKQLEKGALRQQPGHVIDLVPTILDVASCPIHQPATANGPALPGKSLLPAITQNKPIEREAIWWLHEDNRALRMGDWKLVAAKGEAWELYDLSHDRSESHDLAKKEPARVVELEAKWNALTDAFTRDAKDTR